MREDILRTEDVLSKEEESMTDVGAYLGGPTEIAGREPLIGTKAPSFQLQDDTGSNVTLRRLTRRGPLLIHLYRGNW